MIYMYDIVIWKYENGVAHFTTVSGKLQQIRYYYRQMYKNNHSVRMIQIYDVDSGELILQFGA